MKLRPATLLFALALSLRAQKAPPEGIWQGYDPEWGYVGKQIVALAQALPPEKFSWRPDTSVRSFSEVFMHIAISNFWLLSVTGTPLPSELKQEGMEKKVTDKAEVILWLRRSFDAVAKAHVAAKPEDLAKRVKIADRLTNVDGIYLRILVHANEHMGQLVAYDRINHIAPPWSE